MLNKPFLTLVLAFITLAPVNTALADKAQIIEDVLNEKGFYDANEIEKRLRFEALDLPLPEVEGELVEKGGCLSTDCLPDININNKFIPTLNRIDGITNHGIYLPDFRIKFNANAIPENKIDYLYDFEVVLVKDESDICMGIQCHPYKIYSVSPEFNPNGSIKIKQFISVSDMEPGNYRVAIRAIHQNPPVLSGHSSLLESDKAQYPLVKSGWSNQISITVNPYVTTLSDISNSSLKTCLINNGYSGTTLVSDIEKIECSNQGLVDADKNQITEYFSGVRYIDISNNPALTGISGLGKLPHLKILDISENPNFNTANLGNFGDLDALIMRNMGQTNMLMPVPAHNATYVDYSGNHFSSWQPIYEDRRDNAIQSLNLSNTNFATANASTLLTPPSSDDVYINAINVSDNELFTDVSVMTQIKGLEHVNVNDTELSARPDLTGLGGLCSLSMANTDILSLEPTIPIQYLNLKNNSHLRIAKPLQSAEYRPHWTDLSGSNAIKCHKYYSYLDKSQPGSGVLPLTDFTIVDPATSIYPLPQCETQTIPVQYTSPDICKPAPVLDMAVYEDVNTSKRVIHWTPNPNHDYVRWGVTHYLITAYKNGNIVNEFTSSYPSTTLVTNSLDPDKYTISICTEFQCGYSKEVTDFEQGLTKVFDSSGFWNLSDPNNLTFQLKFKYPQQVFDKSFGKPDYFEITPGFNQPGHNDPIVIPVLNSNHNCVKGDVIKPCEDFENYWYSDPISENQYIGKDFVIKACRNDIGCGQRVSVRLPNPLVSDDLPVPGLDNQKEDVFTQTEILLTWNNQAIDAWNSVHEDFEDIHYIEITEEQPVRTVHGVSDQIPWSKEIVYYHELDGNNMLNLTRIVKGTYRFKMKACTRNRQTGDVCSEFSDEKPVELHRNNITQGTFNRAQPSTSNVYRALHVEDSVEAIIFEESNSKPDYYSVKISSEPGTDDLGASCGGGSWTHGIIQSNNNNRVKLVTTPNSKFISTYNLCKNPIDAGSITISSCFDGIGCNHVYYSTSIDYQNLSQIGNVEFLNTNESLNSNPIGGPGDMRPGAWWNPHMEGTGWHFYWANELRYPSMHTQHYGETYDLLGIWLTYQLIDGDWSPVWMRAHLKQENNPSNPATCENFDCSRYFEGDLTYVTRDSNGVTHHKVGYAQVFFDSADPTIPDGNRDVLLKMDVDTNDGLLTMRGLQFPDSVSCMYDNDEPTINSDRNCPWLSSDGSLYMPLTNYDNTAYGNPNIGGPENDINHYSGMWSPLNSNGTVDTEFTYMVDIIKNYEWAALLFYDNDGLPIWGLSDSCCSKTTENKLDLTYYSLQRGFDPLNFTPDDWSVSEHAFEIGSDLANNRTFSAPGITGYRDMNLQVYVNGGGQWSGGRQASVYTGGQRALAKQASFHDIRFFVNGQNETITECDPNTAANGECVIKFTWFTDDDFIDIKPFYRKDNGALTSLTELCGLPLQDNYVVTDYTCTIYQPGNYKFELAKPSEESVGEWVTIAESKELTIEECNSQSCMVNTPLTSETPFSGELPELESGHESVGASSINFSVDQSGQANATYPIYAGVGTAGVAPIISLKYSSAGGDGHIGVGWSISGVTVINRCRETAESKDTSGDLIPSPITYGSEDRFCLNGERLFAVSGAYGNNGTEYRTEKEQFARVISYDSSSGDNNPDFFTVERKDGSISFYGNTVDSNTAISSSDTTIDGKTFTWAINRYQDSKGNYIDYSYNQYGAGEFTLSEINYTGNESATPKLLPYSKIHFTYEDRPTSIRSYMGGVAFDITKQLASIQSNIDGTEVRDYTLLYNSSNTSSRNLLVSILECRGDNCMPLTEFDWSQPNKQFENNGSGNTTFPKDIKSAKLGDVNGDGRADLVFVDEIQNVFKVAFANGHSGFGVSTSTGVTAPFGSEIDNKWHLIDYNADGRQDLMRQSAGLWRVHLATASGYNSSSENTGVPANSNDDFKIVDMNGDGLADLLYPNLGLSVRYLQRTPTGYAFSSNTIPLQLPTHPNQVPEIPSPPTGISRKLDYAYHLDDDIDIHASDINGDGVADLILRVNVWYLETLNENSVDDRYYFTSAGEESSVVNGEPGEIIDSSHWMVFINNGINANNKLDYSSEFYYIKEANVNGGDDYKLKYADINADGMTDVLTRQTENNWQYRMATGKGFTTPQAINTISNERHSQLVDVNLDGFLDLLYPNNATDKKYYYRSWTGTGFSTSSSFSGAKAQDLNQNVNLFLDFDGDGATDHLRIDGNGIQRLYPREDNYKPADKITTITNGLKSQTKVLYRPLTFSTAYQQGGHQTTALNWGNGSPVLDMMGAIYVVRQLTSDAPIEGNELAENTIRYRYANARIQTGGRGFLGFEKIITETPVQSAADTTAKILETTTTYRQDFPFNGLPDSTVVKQLNADFYDNNNSPPVCNIGDHCFPQTCPPGQICYDPQRGATATVLSEVINTPLSIQPTTKSHFAYIQSSETKTYSPEDGSLLKTVTQSSSHDSYGNPLTNTTVIKNGAGVTLQTNTVTNTYDNITTPINGQSRWHIGLLRTSTVTQLRSGESSVTTLTEYDYDDDTGLLTEERQHADEENTSPTVTSDLFLRVQHDYDQYGNNIKVRSCTNHLTATECKNDAQFPAPDKTKPYQVNRYNRMTYDLKGRYIKATYNTLGQKISDVTSRDIYGNPTTTLDLLGRTTTNVYDAFGRLTSTRNNLGEWSQTSRSWCAGLTGELACPDNRAESIRIRTKTSGGGVSYKYLDRLGREIATIEQSFNATDNAATDGDERYIVNQVWFDELGRQIKTEGPYFLGDTTANIPVNEIQYDRYNRPTLMTLPDLSTEAVDYDGFTITKINGKGQRKQETKNALGQLVEVKDFDQSGMNPNYQNTLEYSYNSQGLVTTIKRTTDGVTEMLSESRYDKAGRKYYFDDVDSGLMLSTFNAEGEVLETEDAKGQVLNNYYDNLGRVYLTESWDGNTLLTSTKNTFKSSTGLLEKEERFLGNQTLPDYKQTHTYDTLNRPITTQINFQDTVCGGFNCNYTMAIYYDKYSRIKYQQDASGEAIQNNYNERGFLNKVTAANSGQEYYRINKTDKWGNITQDVRANNTNLLSDYTYNNKRGWIYSINSIHQNQLYEFDILGNLNKRADIDKDLSECFQYDRLNRLRHTYRFDNFNQMCSQTSGHIEHQEIKYDGRGNITEKDGQTYSYNTALPNAIGASPHQVQTKGATSYIYDPNGNNTYTSHFTNKSGITTSRNIEYTAFDKISRIYTGSELNPYEESLYRYDTSEQRFARIDKNNQGDETITHFIGNVEVEFNTSGQIAYKRQLGNYAIITETINSTEEAYLFTDHLGSVDVITDKNGQVLQNMSFSAWGERRLPTDWNAMTISQTRSYISDYTTKGFTGHEMLDAFGIINMGGRIYDAALGRVLQADPFVQEPTNSQSFNRYTYVFNNPLSYTDPSGFITLRQVIGIAVGIALAYFLGPLATSLLKAMLVGFTSGFVSGAIITGSLKGALKSGLIGAAVAGVMFQVTGGAADTGDPDAPKGGGAGDVVSSNSTESANEIAKETVETGSGVTDDTASAVSQDAVSHLQGSNASNTIGKAIDNSATFEQQVEIALQKGHNNIFNSSFESVENLSDISASLIPGKQTYLLDKEALFTALITTSTTTLAAINWSAEFAVDSAIKNNRILADELAKTATTYGSHVLGYNQLQRQIMYGMGASVAAAPVLHYTGVSRAVVYTANQIKHAYYFVRADIGMQKAITDGVGLVLGSGGEMNAIYRLSPEMAKIFNLGNAHALAQSQRTLKIIKIAKQ